MIFNSYTIFTSVVLLFLVSELGLLLSFSSEIIRNQIIPNGPTITPINFKQLLRKQRF
jgi:hypothetical protein